MEALRLRVQLGNVVFEAEGPVEAVQSAYADFRDDVGDGWLDMARTRPSETSRRASGDASVGALDADQDQDPDPERGEVPPGKELPITSSVRLFMRKTGVTEEDLEDVVYFDGEDIHFVREPNDVALAVGQIQWSLLLALKNALLSGDLEVDPEDVRSICQEKGFYDSSNFSGTFKKASNKQYFKGLMVGQGDPQALTSEGVEELGTLVKRLASSQ